MKVIVAGAGIGGLTAALSLHAAGIDVLVIDAAVTLRPLGVGINLMPHAVRELTELGLGDALAATGIPTAEHVHFDRHGNRIWGFASGLNIGYRWPQYSIHRGELQMILLDAVRARLGPQAVRAGTVFTEFTQSPSGVQVVVRDRGSGTVSALPADVLVGADGLYSGVRAQLHPDEPAPCWSGIMMWRGVVEGDAVPDRPHGGGRGDQRGAEVRRLPDLAPGRAARPGAGQLGGRGHGAGRFGDRRGLEPPRAGRGRAALVRGLDVRLAGRAALITGAPQILEYPMVDRDPLPFWGTGRVTLLGDAAHPMYPVGANGGSQAIVDARVLAWSLARALSSSGTPAEGLAAYEAARRQTVNAIVLANRDMPADRLLHLVSMRAPDGFGRIEDVLSATELAAFDQAYRSTTLPDVAALNSRPSFTP